NGAWGLAEIRAALEDRWKSASTPAASTPAPSPVKEPIAKPTTKVQEPVRQEKLDFSATRQESAGSKSQESAGSYDNVVRSRMHQDIWGKQPVDFLASRSKWLGVGGL